MDMYTDHQGTDNQCALMISVAPAVPPVSVNQCLVPVPHQCPSELPFSVTHQCQSVPPISAASQCHLSVLPVSAA
ncbi:unnamed protein product [Staurois parvus]|uniref:Uncharacterized protein n=1 Tax=Staurois parvus TaxID=386267 RepID=A0ABN9D5G5_9NEOB|nr:unnamed protein product [Staurois parvus]